MAIQLKNSVFIHIPKTGGRWVKHQIMNYVSEYSFIGDPIYDAHKSPDTALPVFAFVRHPILMANSLWHHRSRKRSNTRAFQWDWQQDIALERECGDANYIKFFTKIADRPEILTSYFDHFTHKYENIQFGKMETIATDLVNILKLYKEDYNNKAIMGNANVKIGNAAIPLKLPLELYNTIMENESKFCDKFGYTEIAAFNGALAGSCTPVA